MSSNGKVNGSIDEAMDTAFSTAQIKPNSSQNKQKGDIEVPHKNNSDDSNDLDQMNDEHSNATENSNMEDHENDNNMDDIVIETSNHESDGEEDSEDDSSEEDGSVSSEGPRAEDTVSINTDSDQEQTSAKAPIVSSQTKTKNKDIKHIDKNVDSNGDSQSHEVHNTSDNDERLVASEKSKSVPGKVPSRNTSRSQRSYGNSDSVNGDDDSDVDEISSGELNCSQRRNEPIVINDAKSLVEMASKQMKTNDGGHKKEPTVVIIDTNSIMSGKGPLSTAHNKSYPSLSVSAEHLYQSIAARGTTVTPVHAKQTSTSVQTTQQSIILPSLTDDMYVVEAPSFIVPYVYEKPSVKAFREFVDVLGRELEKQREKEELERSVQDKVEREKHGIEKKEKAEEPEKEKEENKETEKDPTKNDPVEILDQTTKGKKHKKDRKQRANEEDDASWDGQSSSDSEDEVISDDDQGTTIVIKDKEDDSLENLKNNMATDLTLEAKSQGVKSDNYFENALGTFFTNIGVSLVQEFVQTDLLKQQKRKLHKELKTGGTNTKPTESAIISLSKNLEFSKENNAPYVFQQKKCKFCSFKTESMLAMAHHMETPHMKNNVYSCNFCSFEIKSPHDILYHMEEEHNTRGRLERAPAYHQCANCPFEDNGKGKLARHLVPCAKKFKPELNLAPPVEWEPPAKIPKMARARNTMMSSYQAAFNRSQAGAAMSSRTPLIMSGIMPGVVGNFRPRGRSPMATNPRGVQSPLLRGNMMRHAAPQLMPSSYPIMNNQGTTRNSASKLLQHQPSISITPLPRAPLPAPPLPVATQQQQQNSKGSFVICEICDGYIKDLMTLRNHMQWIHKVKIHIKMIYNRPPLNCQKCQFRFFTDQGLERHLLGSHGLVTSSMQEAANKGKDAGRCPVCGRVYQWKLLNHVARDHNLTLKPAHLSYKCTVCTATFGMYKQFENHVYSAHSVVAKRVIDKSKSAPTPPKADASLLMPLKINDEITIIPQPTRAASSTATKAKKE